VDREGELEKIVSTVRAGLPGLPREGAGWLSGYMVKWVGWSGERAWVGVSCAPKMTPTHLCNE
jgi:hypothetical protein